MANRAAKRVTISCGNCGNCVEVTVKQQVVTLKSRGCYPLGLTKGSLTMSKNEWEQLRKKILKGKL